MVIRTIPHDLSPELARVALQAAFDFYRERFPGANIAMDWKSDRTAVVRFAVKALVLTGTVDLQPRGYQLALQAPFVFKIFQKQAVRIVEEQARRWIARAKAGELNRPQTAS
jgi:hypothetical protein